MIDWQALRDTTGTLSLLKVAAEMALDIPQCLHGTHIDVEQLEQPFQSLKVWQELALLRNIQDLSQQHIGLGLMATKHYGIADLGLLGLGMASSKTLGQALEYPAKYQAFGLSFSKIQIEPGEQQFAISLEEGAVPSDCQDFCRERGLAIFRRWAQELCPNNLAEVRPLGLQLRSKKPTQAAAFEEFFDCDIEFSASHNRLYFKSHILALKLASSNRRSHLICDHYGQQFRQQLQQSGNFIFSVCESIQQLGFHPSAAQVALTLDLSERKLRRQLAEQGSSLRQCIFETRMRQACIELKQKTPIEQVALNLGYQDKTSFSRAFKAYTGTSPGRYLGHTPESL